MTEQLQAFWLDPRQILKVVVYTLLLVNFGIYFADDLHFASFTMRDGGALLDWTASSATATVDSTERPGQGTSSPRVLSGAMSGSGPPWHRRNW